MNKILPIQQLKNTNGYLDLTPSEMQTIASFVITNEKKKTNSNYLEIGIFGGGTIYFLKTVTKTTKFVGVDLFEDFIINNNNTHVSGTFTRDDVQLFLGDRTDLIKGDSDFVIKNLKTEMLKQRNKTLDYKFDFIFVDANHTYKATKQDFINAQEYLEDGGYIAFHNCSSYIFPDFDYVKADGGPWLVTQELILGNEWKMVAKEDRLRVFAKNK